MKTPAIVAVKECFIYSNEMEVKCNWLPETHDLEIFSRIPAGAPVYVH